MALCTSCEKTLCFNDIGATKKFLGRGSTSYLCRNCLAVKLGVTPELIEKKIEQFKLQGCTLFV